MLKIFSNYRRVYVTRNNQTVEVTSGDEITQNELATMVCEGDVVCVNEITGDVITFAGTNARPVVEDLTSTPVVEDLTSTPVVEDLTSTPVVDNITPASDAGLVPVPVDTRSKNAKA